MPDVRVGVVAVQDGNVLLVRHWRRGHEYWVIPGGRVRDFERLDDAAIREMREETGLEIRPGPLVAVFEIQKRQSGPDERRDRRVIELVFMAESFTGNLASPRGGPVVEAFDSAEFVDPAKLLTLDVRPIQLRPLLQQLAAGIRPIPRYHGDLTAPVVGEQA